MQDQDSLYDDIGPELITHLYDPETGMKAVVVVDSVLPGGGGIRMLPDITTAEIAGLARAMTYKFSIFDLRFRGLPYGGAKAGIFHDPNAEDRDAIVAAFGRAASPLIRARLFGTGADMGISEEDVLNVYRAADAESRGPSPESLALKDGMPMDLHYTGFGIATAAEVTSKAAGFSIEGATVAIEGFGKSGVSAAMYLSRLGARVVAVSTIEGLLYDPAGLDIEVLRQERSAVGDAVVRTHARGEKMPKEALFSLPVDVLIPGARPYVIRRENASEIQAKVVVEGANIPTTEEAAEILHSRGVLVAPDFVSNGGGLIAVLRDREDHGKTPHDRIFEIVRESIRETLGKVLQSSTERNSPPRSVAIQMARKNIASRREESRRLRADWPAYEKMQG